MLRICARKKVEKQILDRLRKLNQAKSSKMTQTGKIKCLLRNPRIFGTRKYSEAIILAFYVFSKHRVSICTFFYSRLPITWTKWTFTWWGVSVSSRAIGRTSERMQPFSSDFCWVTWRKNNGSIYQWTMCVMVRQLRFCLILLTGWPCNPWNPGKPLELNWPMGTPLK